MTETQSTIAAWADAAFGPAKSLASIAARANREMAELLQKVVDLAPDEAIVEEAADVLIVLARYAAASGQEMHRYVAPRLSCSSDRFPLACSAARALLDLVRDSKGHNLPASRIVTAVAIARTIADLIQVCGGNAQVAIDAKMEVNRLRRWKLDGVGHGQHVEDQA